MASTRPPAASSSPSTFEVADGELRDVAVSGDFFLYPEEALTDITAALEGLSVDLTESGDRRAGAVAMPRDAELLGSSPEAIAAAVRRALAAERRAGLPMAVEARRPDRRR